MADNTVTVGFKAETRDIDRGIVALENLAAKGAEVDKSISAVEGAVNRAGKSLDTLGKGSAQGAAKLGEVGDKARQAAAGLDAVDGSARRGAMGVKAYALSLFGMGDAAKKAADDATQSMDKATLSAGSQVKATKLVSAQLVSIADALRTGDINMQGLMLRTMAMEGRFGGLAGTFRAVAESVIGIINPFTIAAAAAGGLYYAISRGRDQQKQFADAIVLSGNAARTSVAQLNALQDSVGMLTGRYGDTAAALTELVKGGKVATENLGHVAQAVVAFAAATGQKTDEVAKKFADLGKAPLKSAAELSESMGMITGAAYQQATALEQAGRHQEAVNLLQKDFAKGLDTTTAKLKENAGTFETWWNAVRGGAGNVMQQLADIGKTSSTQAQLEAARKKLEQIQKDGPQQYISEEDGATLAYMGVMPFRSTASHKKEYDEDIKSLKELINTLDAKDKKEKEVSAAESAFAKAHADSVAGQTALQKALEDALTPAEKLAKQLSDIDKNARQALAENQLPEAVRKTLESVGVKVQNVDAAKVEQEREKAIAAVRNADYAKVGMDNWLNVIAWNESNGEQFNKDGSTKINGSSTNPAIGKYQIQLKTAQQYAKVAFGEELDLNALKTDENYGRKIAEAYLKYLLKFFNNDYEKAISAYNAGEGTVKNAAAAAAAHKDTDWHKYLTLGDKKYWDNGLQRLKKSDAGEWFDVAKPAETPFEATLKELGQADGSTGKYAQALKQARDAQAAYNQSVTGLRALKLPDLWDKITDAKERETVRSRLQGIQDAEDAANAWKKAGQLNEQAAALEAINAAYGSSKIAAEQYKTAQDAQALAAAKAALATAEAAGQSEKETEGLREKVAALDAQTKGQERLTEAMKESEYKQLNAALDDRIAARQDELETLRQEAQMMGLTGEQRARAVALRKVELDYAKQLRDIDKQGLDETRAAQLRAKARQDRDMAAQTAIAKATQDEWQKTCDQINQSLTDALMRGFEDGKGFAKNFRDTLKNMFNTLVLRPVISMAMQPVQGLINGAIGQMMGAGNSGGLMGSFTSGGGGAGSLISLGQNAYSLYTGKSATLSSIGSLFGGTGAASSIYSLGGAAAAPSVAAPAAGYSLVGSSGGMGLTGAGGMGLNAGAGGMGLSAGGVTAGAAPASGLGSIAAAAGPAAALIGFVYAGAKIIDKIAGPDHDPHASGVAYYSGAQDAIAQVAQGSIAYDYATGTLPDREALLAKLTGYGPTGDLGKYNDQQLMTALEALSYIDRGSRPTGGGIYKGADGKYYTDQTHGGPNGYITTTAGFSIDSLLARNTANRDMGDYYRGAGYVDPATAGYWFNTPWANQGTMAQKYNAQMTEQMRALAGQLTEPLRAVALAAGGSADLKTILGYAASGTDQSWGEFGVYRDGNRLLDWNADAGREGLAPKYFDSYGQFLGKVFTDAMTAMKSLDLPGWARDQVDQAQGQLAALKDDADGTQAAQIYQQVTGAVAQTMTQIKSLIDLMPSLAGATQDSLYTIGNAMGGLQNLASAYSGYMQNYYGQDERNDLMRKQLAGQLSPYGIDLPGSRADYRKAVEAQDLATDEGQKAFEILMQLQGAFADVTPAAEDAAGAMLTTADQIAALAALMRNQAGMTQDTIATLADAMGGLPNLSNAWGSYLKDYYGDDERAALMRDQVTAQLSQYGFAMPGSRDDYRKLVESQDIGTEDGRNAVKALLGLSDAFAQVTPAALTAAQALTNLQGATDKAYQALNSAINTQLQAAQSLVQETRAIHDTAEQAARNLYGQQEASVAMLAGQGQDFIARALVAAQTTGSLPDNEELQKAIDAATGGLTADHYASGEDFAAAQLSLAGQLDGLKDMAGNQMNVADRQVKLLQDQIDLYKKQYDLLRGTDDSVGAIEGYVKTFYDAMRAEEQAKAKALVDEQTGKASSAADGGSGAGAASFGGGGSPASTATSFDAASNRLNFAGGYIDYDTGIRYFNDGSTDGKVQDAYNLDKWKRQAMGEEVRIPGFASGGLHEGGYRLVGEDGPELELTGPARYWSHAQTRDMLSGGGQDFAALSAKFDDLIAAVQQMSARVAQLESHARRTANVFDGGQQHALRVEIE